MPEITHYWVVTDLETEELLTPDGWGSEWESKSDSEQEIIERASLFHNLPKERLSAYNYLTM